MQGLKSCLIAHLNLSGEGAFLSSQVQGAVSLIVWLVACCLEVNSRSFLLSSQWTGVPRSGALKMLIYLPELRTVTL